MARRKLSAASPTVEIELTPDLYETARRSDSGACLIADAIKNKGYTAVVVDIATIRFTDKERGHRYTYLTPAGAATALLAFDQGWESILEQGAKIRIARAVKVEQIISSKGRAEAREARIAELTEKEEAGEITSDEQRALTKLRKNPARPTTKGKTRVASPTGSSLPVVVGGEHRPGKGGPELLRSKHRMYGARLAQPGTKFQEALTDEVGKKTGELALENERLRAELEQLRA